MRMPKKLFDLLQKKFGDNDDNPPNNSKSSSYLEKSLESNLNANDTIPDEDENALTWPTPKKGAKINFIK